MAKECAIENYITYINDKNKKNKQTVIVKSEDLPNSLTLLKKNKNVQAWSILYKPISKGQFSISYNLIK